MEPTSKNTARPVKRFRIGFLSILQVILVLVIFLSVNFLSSLLYRPFDLSDTLEFTLSSSTSRYLKSDAIAKREDPVDMIVAFQSSNRYYDRIRPVAEEITRQSGGKIRLQLIDPLRAADRAEALAAEYGVVFSQNLVIIDARSAEERENNGGKDVSPHINIIKLDDMLVYKTDASNQRKVQGFIGEDALRAGLVRAIEGKPRKMWVLADKSDLNSEGSDLWSVLREELILQNVLPERVPLASIKSIPEEITSIAIIAPAYDLSAEEILILEEFWNRPRSGILVTTGEKEVPARLRAFLRKNGVTPRNDRVLTVRGDTVQTTVTCRFNSGVEFTRDLWEKTSRLQGTTRSLDVRELDNALVTKGITPLLLLEGSPEFWGESRFPADSVEFDNREDHPGPVSLAAAVIRGAPNDETLASEVSRMVVIANTGFLEPDNATKAMLDLFASSVNWLVGRDDLAGEGPANIRYYKLPLLEPQVSFINRVNLVFLPGFALLIGAMVWSSRRA